MESVLYPVRDYVLPGGLMAQSQELLTQTLVAEIVQLLSLTHLDQSITLHEQHIPNRSGAYIYTLVTYSRNRAYSFPIVTGTYQ